MKLVDIRYVSQLEAAFAEYGAPKAYNDYPVLRPRRPVLHSFSEGGRLGVVGLRLLFLNSTRMDDRRTATELRTARGQLFVVLGAVGVHAAESRKQWARIQSRADWPIRGAGAESRNALGFMTDLSSRIKAHVISGNY
jgi:hypothetical protein